MQTKTFSIFPIIFAVAAGALATSSTSFAAVHHATKPLPTKKVAATENALPPLAAQTTLAGSPPALPAKAWLLMDFESGEVLASANADEALPPASLTKMMTSYLVEQALRSGKLKQTDAQGKSQDVHSVAPDAFAKGVHGKMECVACHTDISDNAQTGNAHQKNTSQPLKKVDCAGCHQNLWDQAKKDGKSAEKPQIGRAHV